MFSAFIAKYPYLANESVTATALATRVDAVATAAIALNKTLQKYAYSTTLDLNSSPFKTELLKNIRAVDFLGLTGRVKLDANGDRLANGIVYQIRGFQGVPIGLIDTYSEKIIWYQDLIFAGGQPPRDRPRAVTNYLTVPRSNIIIMMFLCAFGIGLTISAIGVNIAFRQLRFIKLSSPSINNLMASGCILCYLSSVFSALDNMWTDNSPVFCWLKISCLCLGYSVAYGAMLSKTWRVHVIFTSKSLRRVSIRDLHLVAIVLVIVAVDVLVFIAWAISDPLIVKLTQHSVVESVSAGTIESNVVQECDCHSLAIWTGIFIGIKGLLLIFGIFFAWETRMVYVESLNDSKKIGICVYNTMVMGSIGVVMTFVLPASEISLRFMLINGSIVLCCTTIVIIVFGSKILCLIKLGPARVDDLNNTAMPMDNISRIGPTIINGTN